MGECKAQGGIPVLCAPGGKKEAAEGCAEEEIGVDVGFGTESFGKLEFELKRGGGFDGKSRDEDISRIRKHRRHGL